MALASCPVDGKPVDPDTDHQGRPHGGERRRYCCLDCRITAELDRRRQARAAITAERQRKAAHAAALELEQREPALPGMPRPPILDEALEEATG